MTAPAAPLTRAEYRRRAAAADAAPERDPASEASVPEQVSLAESVVAYVAAAIVAESVGDAPDEAARRRLRAAAHEVFAEVVARVDTVAIDVVAGAADVPGTPAAPAAPGASFVRPDAACADDEFAFAARLFSFTGETPIQRPAAQGASSPAPVSAATAPHVARRRPRRGVLFQRLAAASFSIGVMSIVGLLAVGTTTPAEAITPTSVTTSDITAAASTTAKRDSGAIQAFVAGDVAQPAALDRPEGYGVASMADLAADSGVTIFASAGQGTWVNNPSAAIQWPFPVGVPISAAYGSSSYLAEFSSAHSGTDLTPGAGAEIHAVAAGTVRIATEDGGDYGVTVVIDHIIDGQPVATRYGHMQYGSLQVTQGQVVKAGEVIGKVGQTGKATGPHLHLEVLLNGNTRTDPMPWLYEHTTGTHTVG